MKETVREYLAMEQIQKLVKEGIMPEYTGWSLNNSFELLFEVIYTVNTNK